MEDWQQRVVDEREALFEKIEKLSEFRKSDKFKDLTGFEGAALAAQLGSMVAYLFALDLRMSLWAEKDPT